jgi:seryl-tRNA synthetase
MLDLKWIRENPDALDQALRNRGGEPLAARIIALDKSRRAAITELQELQTKRNDASKRIGEKKRAGEDAEAEIAEVARLKGRLGALEEEEAKAGEALEEILAGIPNLPDADVPVGADESANEEVRRWGEPTAFTFQPKQHFELGEALGGLEFEAASRIAGSRFTILKGPLARLHRALAQFMINLHTEEHGYQEVIPPYLVRGETLFGTGQLPKFGEDLFHTTDDRWLIPTAEVPLTSLPAGQLLEEADFPWRVTAWTPCFRSEAGAAGRDTRGMLRQHQFDKVELVSITLPEQSEEEHQRMTACAEKVLQLLELPYRTVVLSTGDMGFGARKTYDIEVWLPGQEAFREISSCSNCGDFQARRMNARYRPAEGGAPQFLHTLNGSGVAVGRALIAVMENYQQADGSILVPEVLKGYMGGLERIGGDA